jgi:hypothetical protein
MQVTALPVPAQPNPFGGLNALVGKTFMHPAIDYLLVGGAITIPIFIAVYFYPSLAGFDPSVTIYSFILINGAHFAASTLRLYTKPGAKEEFPFLSWGFPIICLLVVGMGLYSEVLGRNLTALYLTWSPYHYAAQTYGIAVMYAMRSGAKLEQKDKTLIWWVCLLPFVFALLNGSEGGLAWLVSPQWLASQPLISSLHRGMLTLVGIGTLGLPVLLFWQLHRLRGKNVPLIVVVLQITNGIWWLTVDYLSAFWWSAIFHSIQYMIIVVVQHSKERMAKPNPALGALHRPAFHMAAFYAASFVLAGFLFFLVPMAYVPLGFTLAQSVLMMTVIINLHHFIVDGFIWRTKPARSAVPSPQHGVPSPA